MKREVIIFFIASFLGSLAGTIIRVETAIYTQQITKSFLLLAFFTIAFMLGRGLASVISGRFFDKNSKNARTVMLLSFAILSLTSLLYIIVSVNIYVLLRLLMGLLSGLSWPIVQIMLLTISDEKLKSRNMNIYFISGSVGVTIAYLITGFLSGPINIIIGSICFVLTAIILFTVHGEINIPKSIGKPTHEFIILAISLGFMQTILSSDILVGIIFLKDFDRSTLGIILSVFSIVSIILSPIISTLISYISDISKIEIGIILSIAGYIVALIILLITRDIAMIITSLVIIRACILAYRSIISASAKSRGVGLKIGLINAFSNISVATSSALLGILIEVSITFTILMISSIIIIPAVIAVNALIQKKQ